MTLRADVFDSIGLSCGSITVIGMRHPPVRALCRSLIEEVGYSPDTELEIYENETLCARLPSLAAGASLNV
jgi:hypothetical protein